MTKKIKWGILSTAEIARKTMIPAINAAKNAELYGIASISKSSDEIKQEYAVSKTYNDFNKLLDDPTIDAVYIPLPNALHKKWVIEAAKRGKHILCEKPAALTSADTNEMMNACDKYDVFWMEGFMYQHHPQHARVKELIVNGEIGEIKHIESIFTFTLDAEQENIRLNPELGGGCIFDVGCYGIHSSIFLLEKEPKDVFVKGEIHPHLGVEVSATGLMSFDGGITASFHCGFQEPFVHQYRIFGSKGTISLPFAYRPDMQQGYGSIIIDKANGNSRKEVVFGHQYVLQIEAFSKAIIEKKSPTNSVQDTRRNMKVIDAIYQSLRDGNVVAL
jgi:D-xylose 1-dehydrogenase (NADP+, D-xylono-1,5-lactone-forming)